MGQGRNPGTLCCLNTFCSSPNLCSVCSPPALQEKTLELSEVSLSVSECVSLFYFGAKGYFLMLIHLLHLWIRGLVSHGAICASNALLQVLICFFLPGLSLCAQLPACSTHSSARAAPESTGRSWGDIAALGAACSFQRFHKTQPQSQLCLPHSGFPAVPFLRRADTHH